jgi:hypothetical protein
VDKQTRKMLNDTEQELLRSTEPAALKALDEDGLLELHRRVRRARNKYAKLYRRRAAAQVERDSSRARASVANSRTSIKAEVFEDALARVSRRLAREAWLSADRLRQDRIAAARAAKRSKTAPSTGSKAKAGKGKHKGTSKRSGADTPKGKRRTGASKRDAAAARAATRRKQASRDSR